MNLTILSQVSKLKSTYISVLKDVCVRQAYTYVIWWHPRPSTSGGCRLICSDWGDNFSFGLTGRTWASHLTKRWGIGWHIPQFSFTWGRSWSACGWSWASWRRYCYCWLSGGWWWSVNIIMYYWMMVIIQISNTLNKIEWESYYIGSYHSFICISKRGQLYHQIIFESRFWSLYYLIWLISPTMLNWFFIIPGFTRGKSCGCER